jgi:hypothetical protein
VPSWLLKKLALPKWSGEALNGVISDNVFYISLIDNFSIKSLSNQFNFQWLKNKIYPHLNVLTQIQIQ